MCLSFYIFFPFLTDRLAHTKRGSCERYHLFLTRSTASLGLYLTTSFITSRSDIKAIISRHNFDKKSVLRILPGIWLATFFELWLRKHIKMSIVYFLSNLRPSACQFIFLCRNIEPKKNKSCYEPHYESEAKYKAFHIISFLCT